MMWVFLTPASRLVRQASTLGIIPRSITPLAISSWHSVGVRPRIRLFGSFLSSQDAGGVGQKDELVGLKRLGDGRGGRVGVDVQELAFGLLILGQRRKHGHDAGQAQVFDRRNVDGRDLADAPQVDPAFGPVFQPELPAEKALMGLVVQPRCPAAELVDVPLDVGVDLLGENPRHDRQRRLVGEPPALHEMGRQTGLFHRHGDRLAAAVNDHRAHADGLHEDHVDQQVRAATRDLP